MQYKVTLPVTVSTDAVYRVYINNELHTERELDAGNYEETGWVFVSALPLQIKFVLLQGAATLEHAAIKLADKIAHVVVEQEQVLVYESK